MANNEDPDETAHYEPSHLDLLCLQKYVSWSTGLKGLTLKAPITTAADDSLKFFFFFNFSKKTSLDISCELSAWQTIHMKYQDLFSLKN